MSRLEKQRNSDYPGIKLGKDGYEAQTKSEDEGNDRHSDNPLGFSKFFLDDMQYVYLGSPRNLFDCCGFAVLEELGFILFMVLTIAI